MNLKSFILPTLNKSFFIRLSITVFTVYLLFGVIFIPLYIQGISMEPTYHDKHLMIGFRLAYLLKPPKIKDVVLIRYAGKKVMLLKRIVAGPGDTVAFKEGKLYVNNQKQLEPYVKLPCNWNLPERKVKANHYYVIGDNRSTSIDTHLFGAVDKNKIVGAPLW